jgi:hypothetical protein
MKIREVTRSLVASVLSTIPEFQFSVLSTIPSSNFLSSRRSSVRFGPCCAHSATGQILSACSSLFWVRFPCEVFLWGRHRIRLQLDVWLENFSAHMFSRCLICFSLFNSARRSDLVVPVEAIALVLVFIYLPFAGFGRSGL